MPLEQLLGTMIIEMFIPIVFCALMISQQALAYEDNSSPAPVQNSEEPTREEQATVARPGRDPRIPAFHFNRPAWGVEIAGSFDGLGASPSIPNLKSSTVYAVSIQLEYQPQFIQNIGIIGFGPSVAIFPIAPQDGIVNSFASILSAGGQIRYQLRLFREQPIVPAIGFSGQYIHYSLANNRSGGIFATGPFLGAMMLLNFLDNQGASEFFVNTGVLRSYLLVEYRNLSGSDANIKVSGSSLFFGLRFEY